eukprot:TRINITY_DN24857_c0_g1_i1.p1 TRINITY_DN24857_c0_g1~~TRINITY_DN24857_c0_g1_i1.p1  ORF type:complete len:492 (-),score=76.76 TRINITY_DN24857_c0_g1_i1:257-1732(-)
MSSRSLKDDSKGTPLLAAEEAEECQPGAAVPPSDHMWQTVRLVFFTVMLLITSIGNQVYFKQMTDTMANYGWFLTQLSTVMYVPMFAMLAGSQVLNVNKELLQKFTLMGLFDGVSGILQVLGSVHTSGPTQVLLSQVAIPATLVCSVLFLGAKFHHLQYIGAATILAGIIMANWFKSADDDSSSGSDDLIFNALFVLAVIPSVLSNVYKEVAFRGIEGDLDVNNLQFWVGLVQVFTNFACMPVYTMKMLGPQRVALSDMLVSTVGGSRCLFFGENQVFLNCDFDGMKACDHCPDAWLPVSLYMLFNFAYNIFTMLVIKHGSAALCFLAATLRMPLSSVAFSSPLIMGSSAVPLKGQDVFVLVMLLLGLCLYRHGGQILKRRLEPQATPPSSPYQSVISSFRRAAGVASRHSPARLMPLFARGLPVVQPEFVVLRAQAPQPRTAERVRSDLIRRLGAASPWQSPRLRHMAANSPRGSSLDKHLVPEFIMVSE